jgi:hypothetical protein
MACFGVCTLVRLKELKIEYGIKEESPPETADRTFLREHKNEDLQQQFSSKKCKVFDGKDQKRSEVH